MIRVYESEDITQHYIEFRPKFQECVVDAIMKFYKNNKDSNDVQELMVDVACGSGQATTAFHQHFSAIIGIDVSPNQIKQARIANAYDHVSYEVGTAEQLPLNNNSVDLLVSATACHRFDLPKFFSEVKRVLKPRGSVALLGYNAPKITPIQMDGKNVMEMSRKASDLLSEYEVHSNDDRSNQRLDCKYKNIHEFLPAKNKLWVPNGVIMEYEWNLTELLGYYRSLAAYHEYMKKKKNEMASCDQQDFQKYDRANLLRNFIKREWGMEEKRDEEIMMKAEFEVYIVLGNQLTAPK